MSQKWGRKGVGCFENEEKQSSNRDMFPTRHPPVMWGESHARSWCLCSIPHYDSILTMHQS